MKKILSLLLVVAMMLSMTVLFTACGGDEGNTKAPTTAPTDGPTEAPTDEPAEKPTLKMVTNAYFAPYEYFEGNKIVGIDADIAAAIADKLGMKLEIESVAFESIISNVNSGAADFGMAGMTVNEERKQEVDFTVSYATGKQMIVVAADSAIQSPDDLVAYNLDDDGNVIEDGTVATKIGAQLGTTGALYAEWDGYDVTTYATANEAIIALKTGDVECVMIDDAPAQVFVRENTGLKVLETAYVIEEYAICVKKGNTALLNKINTALYELIEDGTVDTIIAKYIKAE